MWSASDRKGRTGGIRRLVPALALAALASVWGPTVAPAAATSAEITLPPTDVGFDYQIGGAYAPAAGVQVVSRDRNDPPAPGLYNICYVNGFQTQPDEADFWLQQHPDLVLRNARGRPIKDPGWPDEYLLDITTPAKAASIAGIVGEWIAGCAASGYQAVEIDNLDTFTRSKRRIGADQAVAYATMLIDIAHENGLAIAQKNTTELLPRHAELPFDFAVAEECNRYKECGDYTAVYGSAVFVIEYGKSAFNAGCKKYPELSVVFRNRDVRPAGTRGYKFESC